MRTRGFQVKKDRLPSEAVEAIAEGEKLPAGQGGVISQPTHAPDQIAKTLYPPASESLSRSIVEEVGRPKKEAPGEPLFLRMNAYQRNLLEFVYQNSTFKSRQKLLESLIFPALEKMKREIEQLGAPIRSDS